MSDTAKRGLPLRVKMRHDQHFIEELVDRSPGEAVGRILPISDIEPDPNQPRSSMGDLHNLMESVRDKGVLEPILVRPLEGIEARSGRRFRVISGERRLQACVALEKEDIPAIIMDVEEDEALEIALIENLQRKDLTPFEEAEGYRGLSEIHGYTHEQIASAVSKSRVSVTESLQLLKLGQRIRDAADALGVSSKTILLEIQRAADTENEQIQLIEAVAASEIDRQELRERARGRKRAPKRGGQPPVFTFHDPDRTFRLSLKFRQSEVEKRDVIGALERILDQLKEGK